MSGTLRESPADFRNGDLISRLLAATPPYQTNSTFVPPGLYFSEMLKRFVQAKSSCPQPSSGKRGRKRSWKDCGGGGGGKTSEQPLPLPPQQQLSSLLPPSEAKRKKTPDFAPTPAEPHQFPLWYPPFYPPAYPPVYFEAPEPEPLNLRTRADPLKQLVDNRHCSAFRVPEPCKADEPDRTDNRHGTSYLMGNLTQIYRQVAPEEEKIIDVEGDGPESADGPDASAAVPAGEDGEKKKPGKDLTALIGLELVVDYVKHGNGKGGRNERNVKCCQNS